MPHLYEKISQGDRRTVVRKYRKGTQMTVPGPATIVLKADVALKVTQEYDATLRTWVDVHVDFTSMVEVPARPSVVVEDERQAPLPKAQAPTQSEVNPKTFFDKWFGWLR